MMAAKPQRRPAGMKGQIELLPRDTRSAISATCSSRWRRIRRCSYWLDGHLNRRDQPQENFGRELMELFTFGVEHYTEPDVYAAARVFTGWNLRSTGTPGPPTRSSSSPTSPHSTTRTPRISAFPIYCERQQAHRGAGGRERHAGRARSDRRAGDPSGNGEAHGAPALDLVRQRDRARRTPHSSTTSRRRVSKNDTNMKPVVRAVLLSPQFIDSRRASISATPGRWSSSCASIKEVGHIGLLRGQRR